MLSVAEASIIFPLLEKITNLLKTGRRENIELAYQLSLSSKTSLWPLERGIKDLLYNAQTQPKVPFDNMPLGQLCYILQEIIALSIQNADLETLPEQLYFMPNLVIVEIANTPLISLPNSFCELQKLKSLSIKNTKITCLPDKFQQLTKLEQLHLIGNANLKILPEILLELPSLKVLRLDKGMDSKSLTGAKFEVVLV